MVLTNTFLLTVLAILGEKGNLPDKGEGINFITREEWQGRPPKDVTKIKPEYTPVPYVIIHHSYQPAACCTTSDCKAAMRTMQNMHQIDNGWSDIGYSFAIGGDGSVYVGRGWGVVGAHAPSYNDKSVGICLIGDWRTELPSKLMLRTAQKLIAYGMIHGYISLDYTLYGHRQVRATECPGDRLFEEIKTWYHFVNYSFNGTKF